MKNQLFIFLLILVLLTSGCSSKLFETEARVTVIPIIKTPTIATPTIPLSPAQDPIIRSWHWTVFDRSKTIFYTFNSDGNYSNSDSLHDGSIKGTWTQLSDNKYIVSIPNQQPQIFLYYPASDTISLADSPALQFYPPGNGSAIVTPRG
jgi:hypothetical protein